ncbi:hypothetical protein [Clostridium manihotivorum]|uniref:DUF4491 family protein n=1 Tax=Clostridium manihotivorum TaxID=2320868 RepID=A0A3R5QVW7_9CLOT|nr:hypothetical protein [Clostridium manihotivorum]QAA33855.1 hypothetical protein C1I91_20695 [Clostridium manihotivorum]
MTTFVRVLFLILFAIIVLAVFNLLKIFVLSKLKVNKWIVLALAIIAFVLPIVLRIQGNIVTPVFSGIFVILLLWFIDLQQGRIKKKDEKKVNIRPKAKPNRVKHMNKDNNK